MLATTRASHSGRPEPGAARPLRTALALTLCLVASGCGRKYADQPPQSPRDSLRSIRLSEDFRVELFAAEPHVVDPVDLVFDENGRIYVAEMIDYPEDPPQGQPARSRIRRLEDTDGDGVIDRSSVFAEHLLQVAGIMIWKGGLLVGAAPDILYLKDTDGDGQADLRETWYTGFPRVNPEARITNPRLGIDNWVYLSNSGSNGTITSPKFPQPPLSVRGSDFRFHPLRGDAERASGPAQFGLTFDDWGNRFISHNTIHLRHVVLPERYLRNAPALQVPAVSQDLYPQRPSPMFPLTPPQAWRRERTRLRQARFNENQLNRIEHVAGYITAASGGTIYNGDVFPRPYWGTLFTGDVSANLVRRDILTPDGVTFRARAARDGVEFLASTDVWFRPCHFANAPDGNLYLLDMYREFIETPESIPEQIRKGMDFWSGSDKGRIYRIVPGQPLRQRTLKAALGGASSQDLVRELENTNGWHRHTAHRLLLERQDPSVAPALAALAAGSPYPQARLHALWVLEGTGALQVPHLLQALEDPHPAVREHAVRLSEGFLDTSAPLRDAVLRRARDPELRVRFQLALTLGWMSDPRALDTLAVLIAAHVEDPWFRLAVLAAAAPQAPRFFDLLRTRDPSWQQDDFVTRLAALIGARKAPAELARFLSSVRSLRRPAVALRGLSQGLLLASAWGLVSPAAETALADLVATPNLELQRAAWETARHFRSRSLAARAAADALNERLPPERRGAALAAVGAGDFSAAAPVLETVLASNPSPDLQIAAIEALSRFSEPDAARALLARWGAYSPAARPKVLAALLERKEWAPLLLEAIEANRVPPALVDAAARARLYEFPDQAVAARARKAFQSRPGDRARVVDSYRDALRLTGDVGRGKQVFEEHCARCHSPRKQGGRVGPDLSGVNNKTREELLVSILNPSYAVESRYVNYLVTTKDGRMYDGVISNETPGAITLRGGTAEQDVTVLRGNIAEIRASAISLMPDELETTIDRQAMADLIAYLRAGI